MELLVVIFIALFLIKLYLAECIVTSGIDLSLVEPKDYEIKDWKKSVLSFKGNF